MRASERACIPVRQRATQSPEAAFLGWERAVGLRELTVFTLHLFRFQSNTLGSCLHTCRAICQPIPSAAMFHGCVRPRELEKLPSVVVVEVCSDDSEFRPPVHRLFVNAQAI